MVNLLDKFHNTGLLFLAGDRTLPSLEEPSPYNGIDMDSYDTVDTPHGREQLVAACVVCCSRVENPQSRQRSSARHPQMAKDRFCNFPTDICRITESVRIVGFAPRFQVAEQAEGTYFIASNVNGIVTGVQSGMKRYYHFRFPFPDNCSVRPCLWSLLAFHSHVFTSLGCRQLNFWYFGFIVSKLKTYQKAKICDVSQ